MTTNSLECGSCHKPCNCLVEGECIACHFEEVDPDCAHHSDDRSEDTDPEVAVDSALADAYMELGAAKEEILKLKDENKYLIATISILTKNSNLLDAQVGNLHNEISRLTTILRKDHT